MLGHAGSRTGSVFCGCMLCGLKSHTVAEPTTLHAPAASRLSLHYCCDAVLHALTPRHPNRHAHMHSSEHNHFLSSRSSIPWPTLAPRRPSTIISKATTLWLRRMRRTCARSRSRQTTAARWQRMTRPSLPASKNTSPSRCVRVFWGGGQDVQCNGSGQVGWVEDRRGTQVHIWQRMVMDGLQMD